LHEGGRTIIMVTHDENVASRARRIVRLLDGKIVADEATADQKAAKS
jgi:predicted ABC-type transport system involved in lysophospholipase L1 biosynthesis ATPase subunit